VALEKEEAEAGSGKILKEAEAFWQNKLEAEAKNPKSEETEANSEAYHSVARELFLDRGGGGEARGGQTGKGKKSKTESAKIGNAK